MSGDGEAFGPAGARRPRGSVRLARRRRQPPGTPSREIPIGVPESPAEFEERKRAAERPDPRGSGDDDAQIDYGDGGSQR